MYASKALEIQEKMAGAAKAKSAEASTADTLGDGPGNVSALSSASSESAENSD